MPCFRSDILDATFFRLGMSPFNDRRAKLILPKAPAVLALTLQNGSKASS